MLNYKQSICVKNKRLRAELLQPTVLYPPSCAFLDFGDMCVFQQRSNGLLFLTILRKGFRVEYDPKDGVAEND
ncbi:hypothetical protein BpHYR1_031922 [Brachionus plicatilis]|uniref:Uncharacterized protein n=1 Tax=Brachionus plicatilis TaxID=10195 RepID=A0A3M7SHN6_BRAPC|nr:hypothetical protein BpHYR1_031922 [Brachionus plicatilis]